MCYYERKQRAAGKLNCGLYKRGKIIDLTADAFEESIREAKDTGILLLPWIAVYISAAKTFRRAHNTGKHK